MKRGVDFKRHAADDNEIPIMSCFPPTRPAIAVLYSSPIQYLSSVGEIERDGVGVLYDSDLLLSWSQSRLYDGNTWP